VLIVDDSATDRRLVAGLLQKDPEYSVLFAADGKEALAQLEVQSPDLVLTDLQMPEMNGLELVEAVKGDYPWIPVILMTAKGSEDIAAQALQQGAAGYVPKRRLADDLLETLGRVLRVAREDWAFSRLMHHLASNECEFVLHNDFALVKALAGHLQQLLRCLPLGDETERLRAGIALEEALVNACLHGNLEVNDDTAAAAGKSCLDLARQRCVEPPYCNRRVHVKARISRTEAVFSIRDEGPGFAVSKLPTGSSPVDAEQLTGRGVVLMRTFMDEVHFNETGNEVVLIKRRAPEPTDDVDLL
jgi:CheY-like chemotaxis protein